MRKTAEAECEQPFDERQLACWLMHPKVTRDYYEQPKQNGDTAVLPTPVFFYGPQSQQEIAVEIDPGKTLLIALQSVSAEGDAAQKLHFELNGQSRCVRVKRPDAGKGVSGRPLADPTNPWHVAAPMPGAIINVAVTAGQRVNGGSTPTGAGGDEDGHPRDGGPRRRGRRCWWRRGIGCKRRSC